MATWLLRLMCIALVCGSALADVVDDKIQALIGADSYSQNKNFINSIFANKRRFLLTNGKPNINEILYELKNNGLLALKFPRPLELNISFRSKSSLIALSYTLNNLLSSMGYSYFMVTQASREKGMADITFSLMTEHALDPTILSTELQKRGFRLQDISRSDINQWSYIIQAHSLKLANAKELMPHTPLLLREVSGQYWLKLPRNDNARIQIVSHTRWTPRIVCYDKHLEITQIIMEKGSKTSFSIQPDSASVFMMITDAKNPDALKRLEITLL